MKRLDQFKSYKEYISYQIELNRESVRGYQSKMADACKCQRAYFSRVLNGNAHLNNEQAHRLTKFWGFTEKELEYFLLLIDFERTDSVDLKAFYKKRLQDIVNSSLDLKQRYKSKSIESLADQQAYYSSWFMAAIHVISSIPEFTDPLMISDHLKLPLNQVLASLKKLKEMGLVQKKKDRWIASSTPIHLPNSSAFNSLHHSSWRTKAILDSQIPNSDSLHYTVVQSHSVEDFHEIKEQLLKTIDAKRKLVGASKEEQLSCICIDLFKV